MNNEQLIKAVKACSKLYDKRDVRSYLVGVNLRILNGECVGVMATNGHYIGFVGYKKHSISCEAESVTVESEVVNKLLLILSCSEKSSFVLSAGVLHVDGFAVALHGNKYPDAVNKYLLNSHVSDSVGAIAFGINPAYLAKASAFFRAIGAYGKIVKVTVMSPNDCIYLDEPETRSMFTVMPCKL